MKKLLAFAVAVSAFAFSATAQEKREIKGERHHKSMHKEHGAEKMKDLNLSDAQKSQLKASREEYKSKMEALKSQENISVKEMKERRKALHLEQKTKMESILTADQKAKIESSRAAMAKDREQMGNKRAEEIKTKLGLSNDQAAKLKAQNEATRSQLEALRADKSLTDDAKKAKAKEIKETAKKQREAILTAEQLEKMKSLKKEGRGKARGAKKEWKTTK